MDTDSKVNDAAADAANHVAADHADAEVHHHHSHRATTHHEHGHHLLQVEKLSIGFSMYDTEGGRWNAGKRMSRVIDELSISVHPGEIIAIVGASGSGKTLLADAIMGLYAENSQVTGTIYFEGERCDARRLAQLRGGDIAFVPQSVKALDPLMRVGRQVGGTDEERHRLYRRYGLSDDVDRLYPFQLSGGMARRVLLATALITDPKLIVADEPTPGLDLELAVQAMNDFRAFADGGGGVLLITHDIELALRAADRVAVFRDGTVVEETAVDNFASPDTLTHEFSRQLWHALPEHDFTAVNDR